MKKVLLVIGILAIIAVIVLGAGGYYMYKKGSTVMNKYGQEEIEKFITTKSPAEPVANSLRRIVNGVKLQQSWSSAMLLSVAIASIQDGTVTADEAKMLDELAPLAEDKQLSKEKMMDFFKKHEKTIPHKGTAPQ